MDRTDRPPVPTVVAIVAGAIGTIALATVWHWAGLVTRPSEHSYRLSQYFMNCVSWPFIFAYAAVALVIGRLARTEWPVAIGMVLPLPIALVVEIIRDSTSHNLFPFEIGLYWVPALAIAYLGARGRRVIDRFRRPPS
jgi:hypothetical protein